MSEVVEREISVRIKGYFGENWGAPFVIVFMVSLIAAVVLLILGLPLTAEKVADFAYFTLVIGAALQLVCLLKDSNMKKTRQEN